MVVLCHKLEALDTVEMIRQFTKFSSVALFKPEEGHTTRSSLYMVATNVQPKHTDAVSAVEGWKKMWELATLGSDEQYEAHIRATEPNAKEIVAEFGADLVKLGKKVWEIQASPLAKASFTKGDARVLRSQTTRIWERGSQMESELAR
jgi:hypothetical protein